VKSERITHQYSEKRNRKRERGREKEREKGERKGREDWGKGERERERKRKRRYIFIQNSCRLRQTAHGRQFFYVEASLNRDPTVRGKKENQRKKDGGTKRIKERKRKTRKRERRSEKEEERQRKRERRRKGERGMGRREREREKERGAMFSKKISVGFDKLPKVGSFFM